jgi:hypothetical protein
MQLILPQSELEQAIKNYVNDLMNIKDGVELCIDLRAGRGVDGFTATVDIIKSGSPMPVKTVVPTATPVTAAPVALMKVIPRPPAKEEPVATPVAEAPTESAVVDKSEQQENAAPETKTETPAEVTTAVRRPLFGSLKKPE